MPELDTQTTAAQHGRLAAWIGVLAASKQVTGG
jgi:hypothetical protein